MTDIGKTLHRLRSGAGLTQKEVARWLSLQLKPITHQAVCKWETGDTQPNMEQFLALCRLYGVRHLADVFWREGEALNAEGLRKLREYEQLLRLSGLYSPAPAPAPLSFPPRRLPLYSLPASAGTGQFLDGEDHDMVEVDATVPANADFGVRLAGDSMAPRFADGQVVWVQAAPALEPGETGILLYDGAAYCKRLEADGGRLWLASLNPAYPPIPVARPDALRVFGRVVK